MNNPLILTQEQFEDNQSTYAEFDQSVGMECVPQTDPIAFTARIRNIIVDNRRISSRGAEGMPMEEVWGPTVKSEQTMAQMFKLVPQGTASQHRSTDGMSTEATPPALPQQGSGGSDASWEKPRSDPRINHAAIAAIEEAKFDLDAFRKLRETKLYRVIEAVEVTPEDVSAEMGAKKRKNAKPAIYIRGNIVEPKLRVEI